MNIIKVKKSKYYLNPCRNYPQCSHTHTDQTSENKRKPLSHLAIPWRILANSRGLTPILMRAINIRNGLLFCSQTKMCW